MRSWIHSTKPLGSFSALRPTDAADQSLPPLLEATSNNTRDKNGPLARALALLFEPSSVLYDILIPAVVSHIQTAPPITSYYALIDVSLAVISSWADNVKAQFIAGHPRIGEVNGLSKLSQEEQAAKATPPEVVARLEHLNALYERKYYGLVYITFVNGRSRTEIKDELEDRLGLEHSVSADEPSLDSIQSVDTGAAEWKGELERAVSDVGKIAKARLRSLGVAE